jgi:hypothetical protein
MHALPHAVYSERLYHVRGRRTVAAQVLKFRRLTVCFTPPLAPATNVAGPHRIDTQKKNEDPPNSPVINTCGRCNTSQLLPGRCLQLAIVVVVALTR